MPPGGGGEPVGEGGDEVAELVRSLDGERPVERRQQRWQPVEPLRLQLDAEPASSRRICSVIRRQLLDDRDAGGKPGADLLDRRPGSAGSPHAGTESWRGRTGRAAPGRIRRAARTSRGGSSRPRCGRAGTSGPRRCRDPRPSRTSGLRGRRARTGAGCARCAGRLPAVYLMETGRRWRTASAIDSRIPVSGAGASPGGAVKARESSTASSLRASRSGSTRRILAAAVSLAVPAAVSNPARRPATRPSRTASASSSLSMSGGMRYPEASRYPP